MQTKAKGGINQIDSDVSAMSSNAVWNMLMAPRMINTEAALAEASVWLIHTCDVKYLKDSTQNVM